MALTIALPLSGLEPEHFNSLGARLLYDQGLRCLAGYGPISPSTGSESSGVSSLVPSIASSTPGQSPDSSRPNSPTEEATKKEQEVCDSSEKECQKKNKHLRFSFQPPVRIYYRQRDILNLGANIREPFWQMRVPMMPRYDFRSFMENRSVYYRLGEHGLTEDYPTVRGPLFLQTIRKGWKVLYIISRLILLTI